ncbi:hypothetical protein EK21DRAFT_119486 [Setomelanomma holmii]|uniref:Uncharacterized protein n=1 Tax=Setomelanomma holmii TaxID=210430 RepID=A0A9P4GVS2_9PLEO|nr:hypothetical protein EK21DRAFT_119486 [Setomelanomma holmii]
MLHEDNGQHDNTIEALLRTCTAVHGLFDHFLRKSLTTIVKLFRCHRAHDPQHLTHRVRHGKCVDALFCPNIPVSGVKLQHFKHLEIALNLPMNVFTAIELQSPGKSAHLRPKHRKTDVEISDIDSNQGNIWHGLSSAFGHLVVNLPTHALDDEPIPPFTIVRRDRQTCFGYVKYNGELGVRQKDQYQLLLGDEAYLNVDTPAQAAEIERALWAHGYDPLEEVTNSHMYRSHGYELGPDGGRIHDH